MNQAKKLPILHQSSDGVASLNVSHEHQASEDSPNEMRVTHDQTNASPVEYQQLLSAYQCLQLERDMLRKALRAFRIGKTHSNISW